MPQGFLWLLDLGTAATGSALSRSHLKDLAQPMEDALAMELPRSCFPSRQASLSSFGAGYEGEIHFNLKASPSKSELELYSSPGSGDESQPRRNTEEEQIFQLCDFSF